MIIGIDKVPNKDDKEEYLNIKKVSNHTIPKLIPKNIFIQQSIPIYVATPLPPLNFNQIGNTWPRKTHKEAIYKYSTKYNFTKITGITALRISNTKVAYPTNLLPVLRAFVAPIFPEPISLISFFKKIFVN